MPKHIKEDCTPDIISQVSVSGSQFGTRILETLFDLKRSDDLVEKSSRLLAFEEVGTIGL